MVAQEWRRALVPMHSPSIRRWPPVRCRAYQFLDGSVYLHHMEKARKARGAAMPPNYKTEPLMYQGLSDAFCGPYDPLQLPDDNLELDYEAEIAIVTDEVPMGTTVEQASSYIRLVMLLNDYTLRALTRTELPKGFGFLQAKPTSTFSPVAVTPDELGAAFDGNCFTLRVRSSVNGERMGEPDAGRICSYLSAQPCGAHTHFICWHDHWRRLNFQPDERGLAVLPRLASTRKCAWCITPLAMIRRPCSYRGVRCVGASVFGAIVKHCGGMKSDAR